MINKYDDDDDDDDDVWCGLLFLFICVQCVMTSVYTCAMYIVTWLSLDNTRSTSPVRTHYSHRLAYFSYLFIYLFIHTFIHLFLHLFTYCVFVHKVQQQKVTGTYSPAAIYLLIYLFIGTACVLYNGTAPVRRRVCCWAPGCRAPQHGQCHVDSRRRRLHTDWYRLSR